MHYDVVIAGAGLTGCVLAERLASQLRLAVLVVEQRRHIGGNAFDGPDRHGVLIHRYGPHIFHTNSERVWEYLSRFTAWRPYEHRVLARVRDAWVPVPFNLNSLDTLLPSGQGQELAELLLQEFGEGARIPVLELRRHGNGKVAALAQLVFDSIFLGYTRKQWALEPDQLSPSVTARLPVRISRDDRHFLDRFQAIPDEGYAELCRRLLAQPGIDVQLGQDFHRLGRQIRYDCLIYTGAVDRYFDYCHGPLPYRSLSFRFRHFSGPGLRQSCAQLNYPNHHAYTRTTEFRQITGQAGAGTTLAYEYPQAHVIGQNEPYYPIPRDETAVLYERYRELAVRLAPRVRFVGRLADYKYYNMDQAVARALHVFDEIAGESSAAPLQEARAWS